MWYGSLVCLHGRSRPYRSYQASNRRRKVRRAPADGSAREGCARGISKEPLNPEPWNLEPSIIQNVKLYTKTGDRGETSFLGGARVRKSDPRVEAYGAVDELNAFVGFASATGVDPDILDMLTTIQRELFALGARLADPADRVAGGIEKAALGSSDIERLEQWIDRLDDELPPLRRFILAGGCPAGAVLHVARTVCRRAERRIVALESPPVEPLLIAYINRLSDLLFVVARAVNHRAGANEKEW